MTAPDPSILTGEHEPAGALPKSEIAEYDRIVSGLAELRRSAALANFDLATTAGDKAARAVRAMHVDLRVRVEALRVAAKQPHLDRGREIDAAAKFLTAEIERSEKPLDAAILAKQREKEIEKAKREQAERERVAGIDRRIAWIAAQPAEAAKVRKADAIAAVLAALESAPLTSELYAEKLGEATGAHATAVAAVRQMFDVAQAQEAEAARLAAERARLASEQAEAQAKRDAEDRERREKQEAEDHVRRRAQEREDAARREAQRVEDEQRAAARKVEEDRLAAARAEQVRERSDLERLANPWQAIHAALDRLGPAIAATNWHGVAEGHDKLVYAVKARQRLEEFDRSTA